MRIKPEHFDVILTLSYSNHAFMFTDTHTCVSFYASAEHWKRKILDADLISSSKPKATLDEEILKRRKRLCKTILKLAQRGKTVFFFLLDTLAKLSEDTFIPSCNEAVPTAASLCSVTSVKIPRKINFLLSVILHSSPSSTMRQYHILLCKGPVCSVPTGVQH